MTTTLIILQSLVVFGFIFISACVGGTGMGVYGMVGTFLLVFVFDPTPGKAPIDVMMIIVSVIVAVSALQATESLDYLVGIAGKFLRKCPSQIAYYGPSACQVFCLLVGTAHTCYSLLPITSEIARTSKVRSKRSLSVSVITASLDITGSPASAATAVIISTDILGLKGIDLADAMIVCIPASLIAILAAALIQNRTGKELEGDPIHQAEMAPDETNLEKEQKHIQQISANPNPRARYSVHAFLLDTALMATFGLFPQLKLHHMVDDVTMPIATSEMIEIVMMSATALTLLVGRGNMTTAVKGTISTADMNAMVSVFGIAWADDIFSNGNKDFSVTHLADWVQAAPLLFAVILLVMSIMLFSQTATVRAIYPLGVLLGINPLYLLVMFPACDGYFFMPNYPTEVATINSDRTDTTRIGWRVINHSFQLSRLITTVVSIVLAFLIM